MLNRNDASQNHERSLNINHDAKDSRLVTKRLASLQADSTGFGLAMRCHSPLNALMSQLDKPGVNLSVSSSSVISDTLFAARLTFIDDGVCIVEIYAVI